MRPIKYLIWLIVNILLLLSSCTYDYIYLEGFKVTTLNVSCTQSFCDNIVDIFQIQNVEEGIVEITFTGRDDSGQIIDEKVYSKNIYLDLSDWMEGYFGTQIIKPGDIGTYEFPEGTSNVKISINLYRRFNNGLNEELINSYVLPEEFAMEPLKTTEIVLDGNVNGAIQAYIGNNKIFTVQSSDGFEQIVADIAKTYNLSNYSTTLYVKEYGQDKELLSTSKVTEKYTKVSAATQFVQIYSYLVDESGVKFALIKNNHFYELHAEEITTINMDNTYNIVDDLSTKNYFVKDNGFHEMTLSILKEYGASTIYYDRKKYIQEFDKEGKLLTRFKMDLKFVDHFTSSPGTSYIVIQVAMNNGEMGFIHTDPIELKYGLTNEVILDDNTPIHVELNVPEESLPTRYIINIAQGLDDVLLPIAKANVISEYFTSIYVHEYNSTNHELRSINVKKSMLGELQKSSEDATFLIIEIALYKQNGEYLGSVEVEKEYTLLPHKCLTISLDETVKVRESRYHSGSGIIIP